MHLAAYFFIMCARNKKEKNVKTPNPGQIRSRLQEAMHDNNMETLKDILRDADYDWDDEETYDTILEAMIEITNRVIDPLVEVIVENIS